MPELFLYLVPQTCNRSSTLQIGWNCQHFDIFIDSMNLISDFLEWVKTARDDNDGLRTSFGKRIDESLSKSAIFLGL